MNSETAWMGKYRDLVEILIRMCNTYADKYMVPVYFNSDALLSAGQIQTIEYLLEAPDEKMIDLAKRLGVARSTLSKAVQKLAVKGLLEKHQKEGNKKDIYPRVTAKGREAYRKYSRWVRERCFKPMFALADKTPKKYLEYFMEMMTFFCRDFEHIEKGKKYCLSDT
ncbi:MAG: MarR family winged helix-turn-helix transcriptional regulator [Treponema sp.]|jgi:DNA-binding MarR family transcriptional regulator|nr:MarR family winged helix-turn-helix transcriptional regulator [Treponema sp.]